MESSTIRQGDSLSLRYEVCDEATDELETLTGWTCNVRVYNNDFSLAFAIATLVNGDTAFEGMLDHVTSSTIPSGIYRISALLQDGTATRSREVVQRLLVRASAH